MLKNPETFEQVKRKSLAELEEEKEEQRIALEEKNRRQRKSKIVPRYQGENDYDYPIKILLLGDRAVGKTSLINRFSDNIFLTNLMSTTGVDYKVKYLDICGTRVRCQIWDTAGQEKFHVITRAFYKGAHGIMLVYDISNPDTFKNVDYWMVNIQQHADQRVEKF